jgi:hypothetical protein
VPEGDASDNSTKERTTEDRRMTVLRSNISRDVGRTGDAVASKLPMHRYKGGRKQALLQVDRCTNDTSIG